PNCSESFRKPPARGVKVSDKLRRGRHDNGLGYCIGSRLEGRERQGVAVYSSDPADEILDNSMIEPLPEGQALSHQATQGLGLRYRMNGCSGLLVMPREHN